MPHHETDVTDLAWSPEDRYLASVGLDSQVLNWCEHTFECLHKIDQHQGSVNDVCWNPVGEFLATQSDDRSIEAEMRKPFEDSPGSTFFRRLRFVSPDGAHITASNATVTNNKGFVFIAAVIARNSWTSDICLAGHENTVEVAVRQTMFARPLITVKEMRIQFRRRGARRHAHGATLSAAAVPPEIRIHTAPSPGTPLAYSRVRTHTFAVGRAGSDTAAVSHPCMVAAAAERVRRGHAREREPRGEHINRLVAKRRTKKRGQPTLHGVPSASTAPFTASTLGPSSLIGPGVAMHYGDVPIDALDTSVFGGGERKSHAMEGMLNERPTKVRTLGGDRAQESVPMVVKELFGPVHWRPGMTKEEGWSPMLLGFCKRDLLKDVLVIFARSKTLTKLALD
ncbi:hypothetical protein DENSPDRAFT_881680 [Dentipellis sp. KUC8613]|nr:hypothetical protein DENSPDRAFT_881680 [Dentipellis sp. KUC8613]